MKLTSVDLTSFRSYAGLTLDLNAPRVLIAGLNGSGKSSLRDSIRYCLLGHCHGTDARGAGADVLIPDNGTSNVEVAVTIDGIGRVSRLYSEKGGTAFSVDNYTGTSQAQQQGLLMQLNTTPEYLDAVLDHETFLSLGHADAKALVLSLLNVRIKVGEKSYTLDELDVHYKQAFEDRKLAKRSLAQIVVPEKPSGTMPTVEQIDTQLKKLRGDLGVLQQSVGTVSGTRTTLEKQRAQILQSPVVIGEDRADEIAELEAKIGSLKAVPVPTVAPAKGDPTRLSFLKDRATALAGFTPTGACVLHPDLGCQTPAQQFAAALSSVQREIGTLTPPAPVAAPVNPLTALQTALADLTWKQQLRTSNLAERQRQADRLAAIGLELDALPSTEQQDTQIAALTTRIQTGEDLLKNARSFWNLMAAHDLVAENRSKADAEVTRLESLVEELGPKGARVLALSDALGKFEAAVNPFVAPFGWTLTFAVDPWDAFANGRPVETYSRSERFRIGVALQIAIAQVSGLNFICVDEIDILDVANRTKMSAMLSEAPLDQVLILGTRETSQALPKTVKSYRLGIDNGRTVVTEANAA